MLRATDGVHAVHFEQCGNPTGAPVLFLHGGPGSSTNAGHRRFFDPAFYRAVLFDQRGCGRSTPRGAIERNRTEHLIDDIEQLRERRCVSRWLLFGGSWGSTLALAYAQAHPQRVCALVLRGLFLASADTLEVAEGGTQCYGMDGASTGEGVPHIAGQRAPYLHVESLVYKNGGRGTNPMSNAVKFLSDDAQMKVSAYYGSLDPIPPLPPRAAPAGKPAPAKLDPVSAGKAIAGGCSGCHGETGITKMAGMPNLVGFDPKYFVASMNAYKTGQRKHEVMNTLAAGLSSTDLDNLALFYALQKPGKAQTPAPGNQAAGKPAAAGCAGCHGETGVSTNPAMPGTISHQ